jgi:hypothetical protein
MEATVMNDGYVEQLEAIANHKIVFLVKFFTPKKIW